MASEIEMQYFLQTRIDKEIPVWESEIEFCGILNTN